MNRPANDKARNLYFARACLLGARERLATFRKLGCLNSNDRGLHARAEDDFLCTLDSVWEAQTALHTSMARVA